MLTHSPPPQAYPEARRPPAAQGVEKGPAARRRPKAAREAYSLYVERAAEGANEADGPLSRPWRGGDGTARSNGDLEAIRQPARREPRGGAHRGRGDSRDHRTEWGGEDHVVQLRDRTPHPRRRHHRVQGAPARRHQATSA